MSLAVQGPRPSRSGGCASGSASAQLASSSAARDCCILVLVFRASGLVVGTCPSWALPLPTFSFLSLTWNQVEWPPCVSQVTTGFYNVEMWRSVLLPGEVAQDGQAPRTADSSGFNRWD